LRGGDIMPNKNNNQIDEELYPNDESPMSDKELTQDPSGIAGGTTGKKDIEKSDFDLGDDELKPMDED
jgi:hypothetical protein